MILTCPRREYRHKKRGEMITSLLHHFDIHPKTSRSFAPCISGSSLSIPGLVPPMQEQWLRIGCELM
jgi:hypothetical protein